MGATPRRRDPTGDPDTAAAIPGDPDTGATLPAAAAFDRLVQLLDDEDTAVGEQAASELVRHGGRPASRPWRGPM